MFGGIDIKVVFLCLEETRNNWRPEPNYAGHLDRDL
jgi:hypothetical protein